MARNRPMLFNLFIMDTPSHITHGMWRHPDSRAINYKSLDHWVELAKLAESAKFDAIFFADVIGLYNDMGGSWEVMPERAVQFPVNDPSTLISALASHTSDLGLVWTNSIIWQHPFTFARIASTLDHLTKGRIGWNVVTTASENAFRNLGYTELTGHDERYRWADEYSEVTYKLWEGSWDEDAVVADKDLQTGMYTDPKKVHKINHVGERYRVEGPHLVEPSPQRTPVIFQAGSSKAGMAYAGKHAEGVFLLSCVPEASRNNVTKLRAAAAEAGRGPDELLFIEGLTFVVGSTEEEAKRKNEELDQYFDAHAVMALTNGAAGADLTQYDPDQKVIELDGKLEGFQSAVQTALINLGPDATIRDMLSRQSQAFRVVGTPEQIADKLEEFQDAGVDGVNIISITVPGTYTEFIEHVSPELRRRGLMQSEYAPGTLREKLFPGNGPRLGETHPAARARSLG